MITDGKYLNKVIDSLLKNCSVSHDYKSGDRKVFVRIVLHHSLSMKHYDFYEDDTLLLLRKPENVTFHILFSEVFVRHGVHRKYMSDILEYITHNVEHLIFEYKNDESKFWW